MGWWMLSSLPGYFKRTWQDSSNKENFSRLTTWSSKTIEMRMALRPPGNKYGTRKYSLGKGEAFTHHQFLGFHVCFRGCTVDENYKSLGTFISETSEIPVASKKSFKFKDSFVLIFFWCKCHYILQAMTYSLEMFCSDLISSYQGV